jgi:cytoskeletal protein RodZ
MSIETVAVKTKITVNCLTAMEANAHDRLPPQAYVKSFIRAYADAVGADADMAMNLYLADLALQAATRQQRLKRQAKLGAIRRVLMAVGLIACILLVVRYSDLFPESTPSPDTAPAASPTPPAFSATENQTQQRHGADEKKSVKLKLQVVALAHTWLKVIVDDQHVRSYNLKPEDRLELEGTDNFNLMIGDANGLRIFFNDEPVNIFGSSGQVVNLKLP